MKSMVENKAGTVSCLQVVTPPVLYTLVSLWRLLVAEAVLADQRMVLGMEQL